MDYEKILDVVNTTVEGLKDQPGFVFESAMCMMLEERCKADGTDVVETLECMLKAARAVNKMMGRY